MTEVLRRGRASLAFSFFAQGAAFALLVTRIPAIQNRYDVSDGLLPVFLAAVPVLAGVGSVTTEQLVKRIPPSVLLRWSQPVVLLALLGVGAGRGMAQLGAALAVFGLAVGALDASMNMLGVSLQRAYGRSIMLSFHAVYSLGGIVGASLAWAGAHWHLALWVSYLPVVAVLLPAALVGSRWYVDGGSAADGAGAGTGGVEGGSADGGPVDGGAGSGAPGVVFKVLLPLCLVMTFAYIGDSTVSNWSAKYLQDVLGSSEQLATVPYNVYMVTTLAGRAIGDFGVRRFGAAAVVRLGALVAAAGFAVVAFAPGACVGFLIGSPLVGALGDAWSYRGAMVVPMVLVLVTLVYARSFAAQPDRYGGGHERPRTADVGRGSNGL
ncbi:MFS transporter [Streptomyces sp. MBT97]|uniref:MFS transporter n=1 Tax=Streptomyces sp. MBT97 TaxID=2800411 RepID=UPI0019091787|nr:MFS transporter [Streptomyces sp. MBT97]MBK3637564.1 MFS transporter [Streptomyces sp. MBT97]